MQKFLKGSREDRLAPVPVVLGVTATPERFNNLVSGTESTIQKVIVSADDVRASGKKARAVCSYVASYVTKHPEYADVVEVAAER